METSRTLTQTSLTDFTMFLWKEEKQTFQKLRIPQDSGNHHAFSTLPYYLPLNVVKIFFIAVFLVTTLYYIPYYMRYNIFTNIFQFSSVAQSCPTLCNPMSRSTPGLPVHHHLPELTQTHVHRVHDAIQPSHPLSSPSLPAPNPSQHQSLFQWVNSSHEVAKVLELQL